MRPDLLPLIDLLATPPSITWLDALSTALQPAHVVMISSIIALIVFVAVLADFGRGGDLSGTWFPSPLSLNLFTATSLLLLGISLTTASHLSWLLILTPIAINAAGYLPVMAFAAFGTHARPAVAWIGTERRNDQTANPFDVLNRG